ncbi:hypothetical protein AVEN_127963-1 [Araneus ventricosus]|uniref:Uncharacterized protein n=1 Tax=Araneus ventricosus TaxID=182803 RepID=A0A4Y1ZZA2_ARAVE|nr:hypothetical protein AVEN_127963-1 [Araneus ventricosus]
MNSRYAGWPCTRVQCIFPSPVRKYFLLLEPFPQDIHFEYHSRTFQARRNCDTNFLFNGVNSCLCDKPRLSSGKVSASGPDFSEDPSRLLVCCGSLERDVPVQVSSSSSDSGSKLRGPSQTSPRDALKRDINITKLNTLMWHTSNALHQILLEFIAHLLDKKERDFTAQREKA